MHLVGWGIDIEPNFIEEAKRNIRQSMHGEVDVWDFHFQKKSMWS
jgi:hypothetical protein